MDERNKQSKIIDDTLEGAKEGMEELADLAENISKDGCYVVDDPK